MNRCTPTQRDLLIVGGKPIGVRKVDAQTVRIYFGEAVRAWAKDYSMDWQFLPPAPCSKLHTKKESWRRAGTLGTTANPVGGPRSVSLEGIHRRGQRLVLERNPYYWKADEQGKPLAVSGRDSVFCLCPARTAQVLRFPVGRDGSDQPAGRGELCCAITASPRLCRGRCRPRVWSTIFFFSI